MNIKNFLVGTVAVGVMAVASFAPVLAVAPWNVTGNYEVTFFLDPDTSTTPYVHHMTLSQSDSTVTGDGGYPATGVDTYHWDITSGTQTGDSLTLTSTYDLGAPGVVMTMTGTIAPDGTVSGTWTDNFGGVRTGNWSMTPPVLVGPPTNKNECKKGGWKTFSNPTFKNQGSCVSYVQSNDNAGKRD